MESFDKQRSLVKLASMPKVAARTVQICEGDKSGCKKSVQTRCPNSMRMGITFEPVDMLPTACNSSCIEGI